METLTAKTRFIPFFLTLMFFVLTFIIAYPKPLHAATDNEGLNLTDNADSYTVENEYYKAVIPKATKKGAKGIIKHLYVKNTEGNWSNDLVYQGFPVYGLGFLEGGLDSTNNINSSAGLQNSRDIKIMVSENTPEEIILNSTLDQNTTRFTETWTFWDQKPYFQSNATVTNTKTVLTNQLQFAWMINSDLPALWYGTNAKGDVEQYTKRVFQNLNSPDLNTYPWINWQFTKENVSLGLIFTDIYDKLGVVGETGDQPFEYQLNFELGSGSLSNPVKNGYTRKVNTLYYTSNTANNQSIQNFTNTIYKNATLVSEENPLLQAAAYANNSYGQNKGVSSSLVNSPYFLVRQNAQNMANHDKEGNESLTSIYAPLYKTFEAIQPNMYDYKDQLQYSLNYSNNSKTFKYGIISSAEANNSSYETSLINNGESEDGNVSYYTKFTTWSDSDKLKIDGHAKINSTTPTVKDIYLSLEIPTEHESSFTSIQSLGSNLYDIQFSDPIYGKVGIGIKVNSPLGNIVLNGNDFNVYLYNNDKNITDTTFNFSIVIYPHKGWLGSAYQFTSLHTREKLTYIQHKLYIPVKLHKGVTNIITSDGSIKYSSEDVTAASETNLSVIPSSGEINITIENWDRRLIHNKMWTQISDTLGTQSQYFVGDLVKDLQYSVFVNGKYLNTYTANRQGEISFSYTTDKDKAIFVVKPSITVSNIRQIMHNLITNHLLIFSICLYSVLFLISSIVIVIFIVRKKRNVNK